MVVWTVFISVFNVMWIYRNKWFEKKSNFYGRRKKNAGNKKSKNLNGNSK